MSVNGYVERRLRVECDVCSDIRRRGGIETYRVPSRAAFRLALHNYSCNPIESVAQLPGNERSRRTRRRRTRSRSVTYARHDGLVCGSESTRWLF